MLWQRVVAATDSLRQAQDLSVPWPEGETGLQEAFAAIPEDELAKAMFVIYRWGHWAHLASVTVEIPQCDPKVFPADDFNPFSPVGEAKKWVKDLTDSGVELADEDVRYTYHRAGPNNEETAGAYWKFEHLAKRSMIEREHRWNETKIAKELGFDQESYMDHKPGTDYDLDEKHLLFKELLQEDLTKYGIDGVAFTESDYTISDPMWMCTVRCHTDVPREEWDHDDQQDNPVGSYNFTPRAKDEDAAREAALDQFHSTVPIANLETFQVDVEVLPRSLASEPEAGSV
jgi:hypothetical protein